MAEKQVLLSIKTVDGAIPYQQKYPAQLFDFLICYR